MNHEVAVGHEAVRQEEPTGHHDQGASPGSSNLDNLAVLKHHQCIAAATAATMAPANDLEEIQAAQDCKLTMLQDAASATSFEREGAKRSRAAELRVLEAELLKMAARRDRLRNVALRARDRHQYQEEKAAELATKSEREETALREMEAWMDHQRVTRTAQPSERQRQLAKLTEQAQVAREVAIAQREATDREGEAYLHAQREADRADRDYHASAEVRETLSGEKLAREASQRSKVAVRVSTEARVASKMEAHHRTRAAQREESRRKLHEKAKTQLKAARVARKAAVERGNKLVRDAVPALKEVRRMRDEAHAQRIESVLQLKADTEAAAALIRGKNAKMDDERQRMEAEHQAEKEQLASRGLNPYQVFKQREVDARATRQEKIQKNKIRRKKEELAERLSKEETLRMKEDEQATRNREYEQRFRNELGKHVTDARNREYLLAKTIDGTDVLDPSGRSFRVEPSQVTTIKDAAFGLGYHPRKNTTMAAAVVDLVAGKPQHAGVGPGEFARLVPERDSSSLTSAVGNRRNHYDNPPRESNTTVAVTTETRHEYEGQGGQPLRESQGSMDKVAVAEVTQQEKLVLEEPVLSMASVKSLLPGAGIPFVEGKGAVDDGNASVERRCATDGVVVEGRGRGGELSTFELQALEKARARQKERMEAGEPQVVAGRTFKDRPAFIANPDRIVFKDFVLGKVYRRRVVLTNASLTFNTFKILEMADEITIFFEVTYPKPGRMSAGMTCTVDITFTPKMDAEILTVLPVRTQTGPFAIPVECTPRRVKPKLSNELVVFPGTIVGERETARVIVTNEGAISTTFSVVTKKISVSVENQSSSSRSPPPPLLPETETANASNASMPLSEELPREKGCPKEQKEASAGDGLNPPLEAGEEDWDRESNPRGLRSHPVPTGTDELLSKAFAVRDAGTRYPKGKGVFEVEGGGELAGYGSSEILVTFAPLSVGEFRSVQVVRFEGTDEEFQLVVEASSSPIPVFPAEACIDLRCCVFGKLYIKKIRICNRGKIAMKATARMPRPLRGYASYSPSTGFVQPGSSFEFGLRFCPDEECLANCVHDGWGVTVGQGAGDNLREVGSSAGVVRGGSDDDSGSRPREEEGERVCQGGVRGGVITIPVRIDVCGQALPVHAVLKVTLTAREVEVNCTRGMGQRAQQEATGVMQATSAVVEFGRCFVGQSVIRAVLLRSTSLLPLKFGFVGIPTEVDVQPADGFGVLLPGEERHMEARFSPTSSAVYDTAMTFRTSLGQTTTVRCRGRGVEPVACLSHTVLNLVPCCLGDTVTSSIVVRNVTNTEHFLEFLAPEPQKSFLKVCPSVVHLRPGAGAAGARVEISFSPPPLNGFPPGRAVAEGAPPQPCQDEEEGETDGVGAAENSLLSDHRRQSEGFYAQSVNVVSRHAGTLEESGDGDSAVRQHEVEPLENVDDREKVEREGEEERETWSRHGRWRLPGFLKRVGGGGGEKVDSLPPLALEVNTVVVDRVLSVDQSRVDFGQLVVGSKKEVVLRIRNTSNDDAPLEIEGGGLNPVGPFQVMNALRPVPAHGGTHRCLLQFCPERAGVISETLILSSPTLGKTIRVSLRGEGVKPVLTMEPTDGRLDMGHVLEGDVMERTVQLHNASVFPLSYTSTPFGPRPPCNINNEETFAIVPCEGTISSGESVPVKVIFSPDYSRIWPFLAAFRIEARDQTDCGHVLRLRGRCLSRQVYVEALPPGRNPCDQMPEAAEDVLALQRLSTRGAGDGSFAAAATPPIVLRFSKDQNAIQLVVGCLATTNPNTKSSPGSFEVELSEEAKGRGYFSLNPERGSVDPGATVQVSIAFEPPSPPPPRCLGRGAPELGQWYRTTALVHLRGGYRAPGESEVETVSVNLEGFVIMG